MTVIFYPVLTYFLIHVSMKSLGFKNQAVGRKVIAVLIMTLLPLVFLLETGSPDSWVSMFLRTTLKPILDLCKQVSRTDTGYVLHFAIPLLINFLISFPLFAFLYREPLNKILQLSLVLFIVPFLLLVFPMLVGGAMRGSIWAGVLILGLVLLVFTLKGKALPGAVFSGKAADSPAGHEDSSARSGVEFKKLIEIENRAKTWAYILPPLGAFAMVVLTIGLDNFWKLNSPGFLKYVLLAIIALPWLCVGAGFILLTRMNGLYRKLAYLGGYPIFLFHTTSISRLFCLVILLQRRPIVENVIAQGQMIFSFR